MRNFWKVVRKKNVARVNLFNEATHNINWCSASLGVRERIGK